MDDDKTYIHLLSEMHKIEKGKRGEVNTIEDIKKAAKNSNPKSPFLIDVLEEAEGEGCAACFI